MPPKFTIRETIGGAKPLLPTGLFTADGNKVISVPTLNKALEDEESRLEKVDYYARNKFRASAAEEEEKMPKLTIKSVTFKILNDEILDKLSVTDVTQKIERNMPKLPEKTFARRGKCQDMAMPLPPENSITSYTKMGTVDNDKLCPTCHKTNIDCPGHLGRINLARSFVHPLFKETCIKVLASVCGQCSRMLLSESYIQQNGIDKLSGMNRLNRIYEDSMTETCRNKNFEGSRCYRNPEYIVKSEDHIIKYRRKSAKDKKTEEHTMEMNQIEMILEGISDEDARLLGFKEGAHPRDFIMKSFPVIPPCARPYIYREGQRKEDHLTTCYDEIIRDNYKFILSRGDENKLRERARDLYFHISKFIDNSDGKYCRSPTEKIVGIKQRITKKEGLIRGNIMGKRVNFCGRSVLGPDSELQFGEVAIPREMSKVLTVPETVHEKNLPYILKLWEDRKINYIYMGYGPVKGQRIKIMPSTYNQEINGKKLIPRIGDTVERQLEDGDVVLVNRQPTLYKYSIVGNRVKLVDRKTLGIHMSETEMRQADFDGDEGNIHVVQALDARVEAYNFANTRSLIPNPLRGTAMIGQVYNSLSGAFVMTNEEYISDDIIENVRSKLKHSYMDTLPARLLKYGISPNSGKALFSTILPPGLFYYKKDDKNSAKDVEIRDGVLIKGRISKDHIGRKANTIQMAIWKWFGPEKAANFITDCTFLTNEYLIYYGLTFGYDDINLKGEKRAELKKIVENKLKEIRRVIIELGPETPEMSLIEKEYREEVIIKQLDMVTNLGDTIGVKALSADNPINIMANSGAKGSTTNTAQITGIVGQQFYKQQRPAKRISQGTRCIPYFSENSNSLESRGFIKNSLFTGLEPAEMYFASETARVGSMNSAITTATTGHMHKKMVKVMEDVKVCYDNSVRNSSNTIYQFFYGDGYDVGELVKTKLNNESISGFINLREAFNKINHEFGVD